MRASPASGSEAVPPRLTVSPSSTVWSGPASTDGGPLLARPDIPMSKVLELLVPKSPVDVTVTVYELLAGTTFSTRLDPSISKESESSPDPMPYAGFCPPRNEFCADMSPTVPGASS